MGLLARRVAALVLVLLAVTALSFLLLNLLPGDPVTAILGPSATPEAAARVRADLGLNHPLPVRYVEWLGRLLRGDLGSSYLNGQPVAQALTQRLPATVELLIVSQVIALAVAVPLAIRSALRPGGWLDTVSGGTSFGLLALPPYITGVVLVYVFAVKLQWFPATGYTPITEDLGKNVNSMVLPSVTLALGSVAVYLRVLRADMISTLQEDYILLAKAKGLPTWRILTRHALRPSTFSLVTVAGLNVGTLVGGAFLVEYVFSLPGIGLLTVNSIFSRDYLVVQGVVVVVAVAYVLVNFLVDIVYVALDPRTRHARRLA
jgi:peptide/nickel transport system permease protein